MPAFGLGAPIFLVVQGLVSSFVYSEAKKYGARSPVVVGIDVFVLGAVAAFVFSTIIGVVAVEVLGILLSLLGVTAAKRRSTSA